MVVPRTCAFGKRGAPFVRVNYMNPLPYRLFICGKSEVHGFAGSRLTHLLSIEDPGTPKATPMWFHGVHEQIHFNDAENDRDVAIYGGKLPCRQTVQAIVKFGDECLRRSKASEPVTAVVHCFAGVSRSPAAAFVLASQALGAGREDEALRFVLMLRPQAIPNELVVRLADELIGAEGRLVRALAPMKESLRQELERWKASSPRGQF